MIAVTAGSAGLEPLVLEFLSYLVFTLLLYVLFYDFVLLKKHCGIFYLVKIHVTQQCGWHKSLKVI